MAAVLSVHDFRFGPSGPTLSFSLRPGQLLAVYGPAGSGKTRFLRCLCGLDRGYRGSVRLGTDIALAGFPAPSRRLTPESIARRAAARSGASRVAEALAATRLWEQRRTAFGSLSPSAQASAELAGALASPAPLFFIDGQLDRQDLWARGASLELLAHRLGMGATAVVATHLSELAPKADLVVVWKSSSLAFAGSYEELERKHGAHRFEVESLDQRAVRALCDPFEVQISGQGPTFKMKAKEGQKVAARMLLEGYGDVKAVIARPPTPEEVLGGL